MKRTFDIALALTLLFLGAVPMALLALLIKLTSRGPVLYWSARVGRNNRIFQMPKFRSMKAETPQRATHLLTDRERWVTPVGRMLRATSLDELPQLWSILVGHMSFVGPRPALFNQHDLVALRTSRGLHRLAPGLTGWAQVNGRDELAIPEKVRYDEFYAMHRSMRFDLWVLVLTVFKVFRREGIADRGDERPGREEPKQAA